MQELTIGNMLSNIWPELRDLRVYITELYCMRMISTNVYRIKAHGVLQYLAGWELAELEVEYADTDRYVDNGGPTPSHLTPGDTGLATMIRAILDYAARYKFHICM